MDSRIISVREISPEDEQAWRDLVTRAIEPNPFYEPGCLVPAALHQTYGATIKLAVAESDGRFYGCVPFRLVQRWKFPYPVATSQVRRMGYLGTPLIDASVGVEATTALLAAIASQRGVRDARMFVLDTSAADGPVAGFVRAAASLMRFPTFVIDSWERGLLRKRSEPEYLDTLSAKSRYNLRRSRRKLQDVVGRDVRVVDRSDDRDAVKEYIALEASGYKARIGVAMATAPGEPEYFTDMCARFRQAGRLHLLALQAGDQVVAMEVWIRAGGGLFMPKISYDEDYASFSPGIILQTEAMKYFHSSGARWIDTCTSENNWTLLRLYPQRRQVETLAIVLGRSMLDQAVLKTFLAVRPLHRRLDVLRHPDRVPAGSGHL
jgi:CelD/BcsL family acetyltransferase involved in cellulose biosynthesis